ncbi:MAG: hypothetical protein K0R67_3736, partial [Paenibacillus sp.]|nr:hypothetical protein [Paenibacillus sp.]
MSTSRCKTGDWGQRVDPVSASAGEANILITVSELVDTTMPRGKRDGATRESCIKRCGLLSMWEI